MKAPVRVAVTGAAGQIGYSLLFRIASGAMLGPDQPVILHLLEIPQALDALGGVVMELEDCAFPLLSGVVPTDDPFRAFEATNYALLVGSVPRKDGMERSDLLKINGDIVSKVVDEVTKRSPDSILIIVSNPLDAMAQVALKRSGFPKHRVLGMAGVLDSARMRCFLAEALDVSVENVTAFVLGGHGDTMVPLPRYSTCAGIPVTELLPKEQIDAIVKRTAGGGAEIVALLKTGSAYYAPSAAAVEMTEAILKDKKKILPCAAYLEGEYGINGLYVGVPCKLGARGIEQIIEINLTTVERIALQKSAASVQELINVLGI